MTAKNLTESELTYELTKGNPEKAIRDIFFRKDWKANLIKIVIKKKINLASNAKHDSKMAVRISISRRFQIYDLC